MTAIDTSREAAPRATLPAKIPYELSDYASELRAPRGFLPGDGYAPWAVSTRPRAAGATPPLAIQFAAPRGFLPA